MTTHNPSRAHVITGGFPPGSMAGHDHDYARLRLLGLLAEQNIPVSVANDFADVEKWLPVSRLLITYVAGPYPDAGQCRAMERWIGAGGHWLALHGTSGGRAERVEGSRQRRTVKTEHHALLGGYFLTHPPICKIHVDVRDPRHPLMRGIGASFEVEDEPYFVELQDPGATQILLTADYGRAATCAGDRHALPDRYFVAIRRPQPSARLHASGRRRRGRLFCPRALSQPGNPRRADLRSRGHDAADVSRRVGDGALYHVAAQRDRVGDRCRMRVSIDRILTTHVGSLPRPDELIAANRAREVGEFGDNDAFPGILCAAVEEVVERQRKVGVDVPGDGEFGKATGHRVNYGAWWNYAFQRLGGLDLDGPPLDDRAPQASRSGEIVLTSAARRRDRVRFAAAYADPESGVWMGPRPTCGPVCIGPVTYAGQAAIAADIANFKAALAAAGIEEGFMTSVAPGSAYRIPNRYYKSDEEFLYAWAEAMREEYKAIVDAGLVLQLDDPATATGWDMIDPEPALADYKKFTMVRVEALNYALRDLPQDRIRFHLCWGSWHGPHTTDIALRDIVDVMLAVNAGAYSFEAGNVRHAHEWKVWQEVKLPDGKLILPGVVSHATNVVEHPELVADRIVRFAQLVGRERVIASTDCGLGGRVHPQIAWAKLEALAEGARLASRQLWG